MSKPCELLKVIQEGRDEGHTVFAYVIGGKGVFCNEKNPFAYDVEGVNYFDTERDLYIHNGTAVLFGDEDQVTVSAQGSRCASCSYQASPSASLWPGMALLS